MFKNGDDSCIDGDGDDYGRGIGKVMMFKKGGESWVNGDGGDYGRGIGKVMMSLTMGMIHGLVVMVVTMAEVMGR